MSYARIFTLLWWLGLSLLAGSFLLYLFQIWPTPGTGLALGFGALALGIRRFEAWKGLTFTLLIFAAVALSLTYPSGFIAVGGFELKKLIVPLLQVIMFGMGTVMSLKDFEGVVKMPKGVVIGLMAQLLIMPLLGLVIAKAFGFPAEIAAGILLVGASPSGLASNVMSYLARANLALSITLTAVATVLAPLTTPLWMKLLAGSYLEVDFWKMMWDIVKMVILPVAGGLLVNHFLHKRLPWLGKVMPLVSMGGIALIICIITANGRDSLLQVGLLLIAACLLHNAGGYLLGYFSARLFRLPESDCRTVAIEVGMQNAGLASGLSMAMGKIATVGLAPAVFGPLMNITGSTLAMWWRGKPTEAVSDEPES
jgi:BASS family bile acid:Na+ symporter